MKNNFRRFMAGATITAMMAAGTVFATEAVLISEEPATLETIEENISANVPVEPFITEYAVIDGITMLPLRAVAEHFGYAVEWDHESQSVTLTKGAVYVIFSINENAYAFSRMAPQTLEAAPTLVNNETTYVPESFFTKLLNLNTRAAEDKLEVVAPRIVTVLSMDTENKTITVMDDFYGEVVVNITDETVVGDGAVAFYASEGTLIEIEYANFMTMSIPPQTNAVAIDFINLPVDEEVAEGTEILAIDGEKVTVTDALYGELVLIVSEETEITSMGEKVAADVLAVGQTIEVEYSEAMTRSLPPQTAAIKINIVK